MIEDFAIAIWLGICALIVWGAVVGLNHLLT